MQTCLLVTAIGDRKFHMTTITEANGFGEMRFSPEGCKLTQKILKKKT